MEFALGGAYDQLKQSKDAIAAYRARLDMDPGDLTRNVRWRRHCSTDNQLDEA